MISRFFNQTATVQYRSVTSDMGHNLVTWVTRGTLAGMLDMMSGGERWSKEKVNEESTHVWFCLPGFLIEASDRMVIDGIAYNVVNVDNPMNMGRHREVELKRLESEQNSL